MDTTTAEDIFGSLVGALASVRVDWSCAVSLATDGAPSMIGRKAGIVTTFRERKYKLLMEEMVSGHFTVYCTRRHCVASR